MKKNLWSLFVLAFAMVFTACNDDDKIEFIGDELNGVYKGALNVEVNGEPFGGEITQKVYITKIGENKIKMELKNFSIVGLTIGDIIVNDIDVVKSGANNSFTGAEKIDLVVGECEVDVVGIINGSTLDMDIAVVVADGMEVDVDFNGKKMAADQSSEAKITAFTFDMENEKNAIITEQPVINGATITFTVLDTANATQIAALVPTITISENATISPVPSIAVDFNNAVEYIVTSEDGIYKSKYTVSIGGKAMKFSFEEWTEQPAASPFPAYSEVIPMESLGTSNLGAAFLWLYSYAGYAGYNGDAVNVLKSDDAVKGSAAKLITFDSRSIANALVPGITTATLFMGKFDIDYVNDNRLACTRFGIKFDQKEPLSFKGNYKYTSGTEFVDASDVENIVTSDKKDSATIVAVLYEVDSYDDKEDVLTGLDINNSPKRVAMAAVNGISAELKPNGISDTPEWTSFDIPFTFLEGKKYDPTKKYKITFVCSSSIEGDIFKGAPGSTLFVDEFEIIFK